MKNPNITPDWVRFFTEDSPTDTDRIAFLEAIEGLNKQAESVKTDLINRLLAGEKLDTNRSLAVKTTRGRIKWRDDVVDMMETHDIEPDRIDACQVKKMKAISAVRNECLLSEAELETFTTNYPDKPNLVITPT